HGRPDRAVERPPGPHCRDHRGADPPAADRRRHPRPAVHRDSAAAGRTDPPEVGALRRCVPRPTNDRPRRRGDLTPDDSQGVRTVNRLLHVALAVLVMAGALAAGRANAQAPTFTLAWSEYPSWSVFGVARDEGLLARMEQK